MFPVNLTMIEKLLLTYRWQINFVSLPLQFLHLNDMQSMNNGPLVPKIASLPHKVHPNSIKLKWFQKVVKVNHFVTGKVGGTEIKIERYHFSSK